MEAEKLKIAKMPSWMIGSIVGFFLILFLIGFYQYKKLRGESVFESAKLKVAPEVKIPITPTGVIELVNQDEEQLEISPIDISPHITQFMKDFQAAKPSYCQQWAKSKVYIYPGVTFGNYDPNKGKAEQIAQFKSTCDIKSVGWIMTEQNMIDILTGLFDFDSFMRSQNYPSNWGSY